MAEQLTIHDIARLAGVSYGTVSRVLNNQPRVSVKTRERVLRIMDEHGFVPSMVAVGLARRRNQLIGVLVPSLNWPFVNQILQGIAEVTEERGFEIVLYTVLQEHAGSEVIHRMLDTKLTAGVLAIHINLAVHNLLTSFHGRGIPVVLCTDQIAPQDMVLPCVGTTNRQGAYDAVHYLLQLGYTRIAHIHGPKENQSSLDRYEGYCDALREAGIPLNPALVVYGDFLPGGGQACAAQLFSLPERPEAIFSSSDDMAYGVLREAEQRGIRIPEDIALVGFDDLPFSSRLSSPLTTVHQPFYQMGRRSAELLFLLIETPVQQRQADKEPTRIQLPTQLIVRNSSRTGRSPSLHS
jgi:LacI family transcriptional regulator